MTAAGEEQESGYAWARLAASVGLMTLGGVGMYSVSVALPLVQAEFAVGRSEASLPYTLTMIGFGIGSILFGRLADRFGVFAPVVAGSILLALGFAAAGSARSLIEFSIAQGLLIGMLGSAATFAPLVADTSLWFNRRRGIAVAICASGNYLAGAIWPTILQSFFERVGWRQTYLGVAAVCLVAMLPLALALRRRPVFKSSLPAGETASAAAPASLGMSDGTLQVLLVVAGVSCCVAMSMPIVHIVAYCGDLGFPAARGAEMLALMLGCGVFSRLVFGLIADRVGGLRALLLGSTLQTIALALFLPFDGLTALYLVSGLFGLFQAGIVPSYAIVVREYFKPGEAGSRVGIVFTATLLGMALGGWMSGAIFDYTGSYQAAFLNGIAWNVLNMSIIGGLLWRAMQIPGGLARGAPA